MRPFQSAGCRASGCVPMITLDSEIHALIKQFWIVAGVKVGRTLVCRAGHLRIRRTCGKSYDDQNSELRMKPPVIFTLFLSSRCSPVTLTS